MLTEDVLDGLRNLRDRGLIQEYHCGRAGGCELIVAGSRVSASVDDLQRLVARARIWHLLSIDPRSSVSD